MGRYCKGETLFQLPRAESTSEPKPVEKKKEETNLNHKKQKYPFIEHESWQIGKLSLNKRNSTHDWSTQLHFRTERKEKHSRGTNSGVTAKVPVWLTLLWETDAAILFDGSIEGIPEIQPLLPWMQ